MEQPDDHTPQDQPSAPKPEAESEHADARAGALADLFTSSILDSMPQLDSWRPTNESDSVRSSQAGAESGTAAGFEFDPATMEMVAAKRNSPSKRRRDRRAKTRTRTRADANDPTLPPQIPLAPLKQLQARFNPLADWMMYLVIFAGGCFGTAVVFGLALAFAGPDAGSDASRLYLATFFANTVACFGYAALTTYMSQASWLSKRTRQLVGGGAGIGMWGAMSSMSMLMLQSFLLLQRGAGWELIGYLLVSFSAGILAALAGSLISSRIMTKKRAATLLQVVSDFNSHQRGHRRHAKASGPAHAAFMVRNSGRAATQSVSPTNMGDVTLLTMRGAMPTASWAGSPPAAEPGAVAETDVMGGAVGAASHAGDAATSSVAAASTLSTAPGHANAPVCPAAPYSYFPVHDSDGASRHSATFSTGSGGAAGNNPAAAGEEAAAGNPPMPRSYEPRPITAEIPLIPDPITGEVH